MVITSAPYHAGMLTMDGRCKTLDATADGYVRAEACIVMRLTAGPAMEPDAASGSGPGALADSPAIVLLGSFVNQVLSTIPRTRSLIWERNESKKDPLHADEQVLHTPGVRCMRSLLNLEVTACPRDFCIVKLRSCCECRTGGRAASLRPTAPRSSRSSAAQWQPAALRPRRSGRWSYMAPAQPWAIP